MRGSSALSPTKKIGTRPRGTARTLASAIAGSGWTICGAITITSGRLAVIQPDRLSPGSTATVSKPARDRGLADAIRLVRAGDDEQFHRLTPI